MPGSGSKVSDLMLADHVIAGAHWIYLPLYKHNATSLYLSNTLQLGALSLIQQSLGSCSFMLRFIGRYDGYRAHISLEARRYSTLLRLKIRTQIAYTMLRDWQTALGRRYSKNKPDIQPSETTQVKFRT